MAGWAAIRCAFGFLACRLWLGRTGRHHQGALPGRESRGPYACGDRHGPGADGPGPREGKARRWAPPWPQTSPMAEPRWQREATLSGSPCRPSASAGRRWTSRRSGKRGASDGIRDRKARLAQSERRQRDIHSAAGCGRHPSDGTAARRPCVDAFSTLRPSDTLPQGNTAPPRHFNCFVWRRRRTPGRAMAAAAPSCPGPTADSDRRSPPRARRRGAAPSRHSQDPPAASSFRPRSVP